MSIEIIVNALGWTLLHSLWQGAIIGLLFVLSCSVLQTANPALRHGNALAWLVLFIALPVLTFAGLLLSVQGVAMISTVPALMPISAWSDGSSNLLPHTLRLLGCLWVSGVLVLLIRLWRDWRQLDQFTCAGVQPLPQLEDSLATLREAMKVCMRVGLVESSNATVPMVVGFLKPMIVIPSSALLGLTPRELELIVAHELAHLRRKDHLTNYLLIGAETLFFYHPVVYALTRTLRHERELCCDDLVISTFNERICYAHALSKLESLRGTNVVPASTLRLAATDGPLVVRIARLVQRRTHRRWVVMPAAMLPFVAAGFAAVIFQQTHVASVGENRPSMASDNMPFLDRKARAVRTSADENGSSELQRVQLTKYERRDVAATTVSRIAAALTQGPAPRHLAAIEKGIKKVVDSGKVLTNQTIVSLLPNPESISSQDIDSSRPGRASPDLALSSTAAEQLDVLPSPGRNVARYGDALSSNAASKSAATDLTISSIGSSVAKGSTDTPVDSSRIAYDMSELSTLYAPVTRQAELPTLPSYLPSPGTGTNVSASTSQVGLITHTTLTGGALIHSVTPRYPTRARSRGFVDKVIVSIEVDATGVVNQVSVVDSDSRPMFRRAVVRAVSQWKFEPLLRNGRPVEQTLEQSFDFRLQPYTARKRSQSCRDTDGEVCRLSS